MLYTACCNRPIFSDQRFCPSCGWECYVNVLVEEDNVLTENTVETYGSI